MYSRTPGNILTLTLVLDAQQVYDIDGGQNFIDIMRNGDAEFFKIARNHFS